MKRDFDLIRAILLTAEAAPEGHFLRKASLQIDGFDESTIAGHVQLLNDAGLLDCMISQEVLGFGSVRDFGIKRLTWQGHEFLDAIRDNSIWARTKKKAKGKGGAMSFEVIKAIATAFTKDALGLG